MFNCGYLHGGLCAIISQILPLHIDFIITHQYLIKNVLLRKY
jgi:hypothetical protein